MNKLNLHQRVCYIISYRESSPDRKRNLNFVLNWIYNYLPQLNILVVEQDEFPKLELNLPPNCSKSFLYNKGLFNKGWALNWAAHHTEEEILIFGDADVFLLKEDYLKCLEACTFFDAVSPHKNKAIQADIINENQLVYKKKAKRNLHVFAAGIFMIKKSALDKIGGWDERFEGWGGEDDVLSHLITNYCSTCVFDMEVFHLSHKITANDGRRQPNYDHNLLLAEELLTLSGPALDRYRRRLRSLSLGNPDKYDFPDNSSSTHRPCFVLAITTFNRLDYLQELLASWLSTRSKEAYWQVIIADDGSTDGTVDYIQSLSIPEVNIIVIRNQRKDITHQTNSIIHRLEKTNFDLCFKCDDDVIFKKPGWDILYWKAVNRTGYDHFCFYDRTWRPGMAMEIPVKKGNLICYSTEYQQGAFFTLTPRIIEDIGYFDRFNLGFRGFEHDDYSLRCRRAGYNSLESPFDLVDSNEYLGLQVKSEYRRAISIELENILNPKKELKRKKQFLKKNRIYIPLSEDDMSLLNYSSNSGEFSTGAQNRLYADEKFYPERGFRGLCGTIIKRMYNFFLSRNWLWFPKLIKELGLSFIKIGTDLRNIDE